MSWSHCSRGRTPRWLMLAFAIIPAKAATNTEGEGIEMMLICKDCGRLFADGDEAHWNSEIGEYWGTPAIVEETGCPSCHGEYGKAVQCEVCGTYHSEDDLHDGICDACIDANRYDFDSCYQISQNDMETEISINSLLATIFTPKDIEQILIRHIREYMPDVDCGEYIDGDRDWFAEQIAEQRKGVK